MRPVTAGMFIGLFVWAFVSMFAWATTTVLASIHQPQQQCPAPRVVDGDTINCDGVRIRLLGIDAPDKTYSAPCLGHFGDHVCDNDGAERATVSMRNAVMLGPVTYLAVTEDRYGRTVAEVFAGSTDLQCYQLQAGVARYIRKYDNGGIIARRCPSLTRGSLAS